MSVVTQPEKDYPNPRSQPGSCNRKEPSYICDPDAILTPKQADNLDWLAKEASKCMCSKCRLKDNGAKIGILIRHNFKFHSNNMTAADLNVMAEIIRLNWQLGTCDDDMIILLITQIKQASYNMGKTLEEAVTRKLSQEVFNECIGHFDNNHFYQGLESMVNSYHDILHLTVVTPSTKSPPNKTGIIAGLSLGILVLVIIIITAASLKFRQIKRRSLQETDKDTKEFQMESHAFEYRLCASEDREKIADGFSSSDEGIDSDDEIKTSSVSRLHVPKFQDIFQRQLSDVVEENEDEMEAIKFAMSNNPKNSNTHITEL